MPGCRARKGLQRKAVERERVKKQDRSGGERSHVPGRY